MPDSGRRGNSVRTPLEKTDSGFDYWPGWNSAYGWMTTKPPSCGNFSWNVTPPDSGADIVPTVARPRHSEAKYSFHIKTDKDNEALSAADESAPTRFETASIGV